MAVRNLQFISPEAYLQMERASETRHEYLAGQIFAMAGASHEHNMISSNLVFELRSQIGERPCDVFSSDLRVKVESTAYYNYPDVVVVCGEPRFEDAEFDTLLNPIVLIEILPPSTSSHDRVQKAEQYRRIAGLAAYILVEQDRPHVEAYVRQPDGRWLFDYVDGLDAQLRIECIECLIPMARIYRRITVTQPQEP